MVHVRWLARFFVFLFVFGVTAIVYPPPTTLQAEIPGSFSPVLKKVLPAVVSISGMILYEDEAPQNSYRLPENSPLRKLVPVEAKQGWSVGSGFFVRSDGYIVTNNHVVKDTVKLFVTLSDGAVFPASIVGVDPLVDIALIKIQGDIKRAFPLAQLADSTSVEIGDWAIAVGSPFGLGNTATLGIVSGIHREINNPDVPPVPMIQTDASINQGNSGGPLFDARGKVIGVNTVIFSPTGGSVGIGFAIPSKYVRFTIEELRVHQRVRRGRMGLAVVDIDETAPEELTPYREQGILVRRLDEGGPAKQAGLKEGDIVTGIDEKPIKKVWDFLDYMIFRKSGESVEVRVLRDGVSLTFSVKLTERPN